MLCSGGRPTRLGSILSLLSALSAFMLEAAVGERRRHRAGSCTHCQFGKTQDERQCSRLVVARFSHSCQPNLSFNSSSTSAAGSHIGVPPSWLPKLHRVLLEAAEPQPTVGNEHWLTPRNTKQIVHFLIDGTSFHVCAHTTHTCHT